MWQSFECCRKKVIGKPCEGEPHARFEVAGDGNGLPRHRLTLPQSALVVGRIQPRPSRVSSRGEVKKEGGGEYFGLTNRNHIRLAIN